MNANKTVSALLDTLGRIRGAEQLIVPKEGIANLCNGLEHAINLIDRLQAKVDFMTEQRDVYMQEATELSQKLYSIKTKIMEKTECIEIDEDCFLLGYLDGEFKMFYSVGEMLEAAFKSLEGEGHPDPDGEPGECGCKTPSCYSKELHAFAERLKECLPPWLHIYVDTVGKEIGGE